MYIIIYVVSYTHTITEFVQRNNFKMALKVISLDMTKSCVSSGDTHVDLYPDAINKANLYHLNSCPFPWIQSDSKASRICYMELPTQDKIRIEESPDNIISKIEEFPDLELQEISKIEELPGISKREELQDISEIELLKPYRVAIRGQVLQGLLYIAEESADDSTEPKKDEGKMKESEADTTDNSTETDDGDSKKDDDDDSTDDDDDSTEPKKDDGDDDEGKLKESEADTTDNSTELKKDDDDDSTEPKKDDDDDSTEPKKDDEGKMKENEADTTDDSTEPKKDDDDEPKKDDDDEPKKDDDDSTEPKKDDDEGKMKESEADTTDNSAEPKKDDSTEDDDGEMKESEADTTDDSTEPKKDDDDEPKKDDSTEPKKDNERKMKESAADTTDDSTEPKKDVDDSTGPKKDEDEGEMKEIATYDSTEPKKDDDDEGEMKESATDDSTEPKKNDDDSTEPKKDDGDEGKVKESAADTTDNSMYTELKNDHHEGKMNLQEYCSPSDSALQKPHNTSHLYIKHLLLFTLLLSINPAIATSLSLYPNKVSAAPGCRHHPFICTSLHPLPSLSRFEWVVNGTSLGPNITNPSVDFDSERSEGTLIFDVSLEHIGITTIHCRVSGSTAFSNNVTLMIQKPLPTHSYSEMENGTFLFHLSMSAEICGNVSVKIPSLNAITATVKNYMIEFASSLPIPIPHYNATLTVKYNSGESYDFPILLIFNETDLMEYEVTIEQGVNGTEPVSPSNEIQELVKVLPAVVVVTCVVIVISIIVLIIILCYCKRVYCFKNRQQVQRL